MMKIKDILRHRHDLALPRAQIAAAVGVSSGTVSHVLARVEAAALSWPLEDTHHSQTRSYRRDIADRNRPRRIALGTIN